MAEGSVQRRLAAILAADVAGYSRLVGVAGYSRLVGVDEEGTLAAVKSHIDEVFKPEITAHHGRIFKTMGDAVFAEFASVVDAVKCAVAIQRSMADRNVDLPDDRQIRFRIGVNLGDVIAEGDDIYGDGVNVAQRLEGLAKPGGICVRRAVRNQVRDKLPLVFEDLGEIEVKNIARPIRVFRVLLGFSESNGGELTAATGSAFALPDKPSIAVLPFVNMSGDPEQEYFGDGITEDLITDLSKISALFVASRNAVFRYKGEAVEPKQVGRDLEVRYLLEGSVRKVGDRVRITAQLIDPRTGYHLWAERYDRDLTDIFALQDEITEKIVAALEVKLTEGEQEQVARRYTENLEAYDYFLRGRAYQVRASKETNTQAREMFERAIELDPGFAGAYAVLSHTHWRDWRNQWSEDPQALERAFKAAKKAVALDDSLPLARTFLAWVYVFRKQYEEAIAEGQRAVSLDPNFAEGYARLGTILSFAGRPVEAVGLVKKAMRLDSHYPANYLWYLGHAYYAMGKHEEALAALMKSFTRNPDSMACNLFLTVTQSELGREKEARAQMAEVLRVSPRVSMEGQREKLPFKDQAVLERYLEALRKAGLPE